MNDLIGRIDKDELAARTVFSAAKTSHLTLMVLSQTVRTMYMLSL